MNTTRAEALDWLTRWHSGRCDAEAIWQWAAELKARQADGEALHCEDDLVRDIIDVLATLPQDLILREDAEVMIYGLSNPPEEADLAQNLLWNHIDGLDLQQRRRELQDDPLYGPFCADML